MASAYFDKVTGSNDFERQSWRDSYNGGRAAGDWTGGNNARLDSERAASGGFTNSGSSRELSAGQAASYRDENEVASLIRNRDKALAQGNMNTVAKINAALSYFTTPTVRPSGPGVAQITPAMVSGSGPGLQGAVKAPSGSIPVVGPGSSPLPGPSVGPAATTLVRRGGTSIMLGSGPGVQLPMDNPSKLIPLYAAGRLLAIDRGWSNAADVEDRLGEGEFLSPSWFMNWGIAGADTVANLNSQNGGPLHTRKIQEDLYQAPGVVGGWARTIGEKFLETRANQRRQSGNGGGWSMQRQSDWVEQQASKRSGTGGTTWVTGGGF